jgi:hypothetical protein
MLSGKNVTRADDQQERLELANWIVGFVDGEGCFSVSIFKNRTSKSGFQVMPEFVVTQGHKSLHVLEEIKNFLVVDLFLLIDATITIKKISIAFVFDHLKIYMRK